MEINKQEAIAILNAIEDSIRLEAHSKVQFKLAEKIKKHFKIKGYEWSAGLFENNEPK